MILSISFVRHFMHIALNNQKFLHNYKLVINFQIKMWHSMSLLWV